MRLMACSGMVGYGFTEVGFRRGLEMGVRMIGCDAGSMDPGPYYLGTATPFVSETATRRDLGFMLQGAREFDVPMIIGSAGGGGSDAQLAWTVNLVEDLARQHGLSFKLAIIKAEPDRVYLNRQVSDGRTAPLGPGDTHCRNDGGRAAPERSGRGRRRHHCRAVFGRGHLRRAAAYART